MAFTETPRFPENVAFGAMGGPEFSTQVVLTTGGYESRISYWSYPLHKWDVSHGVKTQTEYETLRAFFMAVARGKQNGFRFKDWTDYQCDIASGVVAGLTSTTFQLYKRYTSGSATQDRKIIKPLAAGFVLKDTGSTLTLTTDYTLNTATGVVTTTTTRTAANLTWSGEFDVPVRFDTDKLEGQAVDRSSANGLLMNWSSIPIIELRNP
jgi:uncharacterized protein (TIGR02217 family)